MKRLNLPLWAFVIAAFIVDFGAFAASEDESLYYATQPAVSPLANFEARLTGGHDFSNPYLHLHSINGSVLWLASPYLSLGIEASKFYSTKRQSALVLEQELGAYGFQAIAANPDWSAAIVARVTPFSGLVNFFGMQVVPASISLIAKGGLVKHELYRPGPLLGTGLEVLLGFGSRWAVLFAATWEADRPIDREWESRAGFRLGPVVRF